jgi:hypothetical protein
MRPSVEAKPARGSTTSLGIGGKTVSTRMARPTPGAPMTAMSETIQSTTVVITGAFRSGCRGQGESSLPGSGRRSRATTCGFSVSF